MIRKWTIVGTLRGSLAALYLLRTVPAGQERNIVGMQRLYGKVAIKYDVRNRRKEFKGNRNCRWWYGMIISLRVINMFYSTIEF